LGAARGDAGRREAVIGSSIAISLVLWIAGLGVFAAGVGLGLLDDVELGGLAAATLGLAAFNLYYGIARGLGAIWRIAAAYAGGSAAQLAALVVLASIADPTPAEVLVTFGLSALVPIVICEMVRPVIWRHARRVTREAVSAIRRLAAPLWVSQIFFLVWMSADQIWVADALGGEELGFYSAAKTMAQVFFVLTAGVNGILLPRIAHLRDSREDAGARALIRATMAAVVAGAALFAAVVIAARESLLSGLFGAEYDAAGDALLWLAIGMSLFVIVSCLGTIVLGWGTPAVLTAAFATAGVAEVVLLVALDPVTGAEVARINAGAMLAGLAVALAWLRFRPLRDGRPGGVDAGAPEDGPA
jgi:O-antigen/teichoic acid export membrane protein